MDMDYMEFFLMVIFTLIMRSCSHDNCFVMTKKSCF